MIKYLPKCLLIHDFIFKQTLSLLFFLLKGTKEMKTVCAVKENFIVYISHLGIKMKKKYLFILFISYKKCSILSKQLVLIILRVKQKNLTFSNTYCFASTLTNIIVYISF